MAGDNIGTMPADVFVVSLKKDTTSVFEHVHTLHGPQYFRVVFPLNNQASFWKRFWFILLLEEVKNIYMFVKLDKRAESLILYTYPGIRLLIIPASISYRLEVMNESLTNQYVYVYVIHFHVYVGSLIHFHPFCL